MKTDVFPTEIVGNDEENVGFLRGARKAEFETGTNQDGEERLRKSSEFPVIDGHADVRLHTSVLWQ